MGLFQPLCDADFAIDALVERLQRGLVTGPVMRGDSGRDVEWELGKLTTLEGGPDKEKSTFDQVVFHVKLPPRAKDGKADKKEHKLNVILKNEW